MREYSTPVVVDVPASARLTDTVFERAEHDPGLVVLRRKASLAPSGATPGGREAAWLDITARQFRDEVAALAKGFMAAGIGEGDRVALLSRTRYEWTVVDYALWAAGAVTVPVYETSSAEQVEWILTDSGAQAIVVETPAHLEAIGEVLRRLPGVRRTWLIEADSAAPSLDALVAEGAGVGEADLAQRRMSAGAGDFATIIYTSGTTGRPKGCEITHGNLLANARNAVRSLSVIFDTPGASTLLFLPLAHSFARLIEVGAMEAGAVLGHIPDARTLLPDLATFQPTFILAVPRVFEKLYNGAEQQASESGVRGAIFHAAARTATAWSRALGTGDSALARRGQRAGPRAAAPACNLRPPGLPQAPRRGRRPGALLGVRRRRPRGTARPLLPRCGDHHHRGIRAHRDHRRLHGEPARPQQDRHRRPAAARRVRADRRRRRDPPHRAQPLRRLLAQRRRDGRGADPRWLAAHRRHRRARRRGLPAGDRPEEGADRDRGRQERRARRAGGPDPRPSAGQPVPGGGGRPPVCGLPDHPGSGGRPHLAGPPEPPGGYQPERS